MFEIKDKAFYELDQIGGICTQILKARNIFDYVILKPENPLAFRINKKKKCKVCLISPLNIKVLVSIVH